MFENIKARYEKGYIRDDQLASYVRLGVISQAQADEITNLEKYSWVRSNHCLIFTLPGGVEVQVR